MTREEEILEIILKHAAGATNTLADGVYYHNAASEIASLPLEVPSEEEIEKWAESCADNSVGEFDTKVIIKAALMLGARWAISEIERRNK
jgi:hypothetical protein